MTDTAIEGNLTTSDESGLWLPAIKGRQGGRKVFMTGLRMPEFTEQIPVLTDTPKAELKEQRMYDSGHAAEISRYLLDVDDYVLPPLVITIDREPQWAANEPGSPFGRIRITPDTKRRITDGMHRGDGIAQATSSDADGKLDEDLIGIWLVVEPSIDDRRMMFADVNRNQKSVPKSLSISFDFRDPYAQALRRLVADHHLLHGVVEEERSRAPRGSGKLFTMAALRDALELFGGRGMKDADAIYDEGHRLFDAIAAARPELHNLAGDPASIDELRSRSIIASSTTLRVMAGALRIGLSRNYELDDLVAKLADVSFDPANTLWVEAGFTTPTSTTPASRNQEIRAATSALGDAIAPVQ